MSTSKIFQDSFITVFLCFSTTYCKESMAIQGSVPIPMHTYCIIILQSNMLAAYNMYNPTKYTCTEFIVV